MARRPSWWRPVPGANVVTDLATIRMIPLTHLVIIGGFLDVVLIHGDLDFVIVHVD